MKYDSEENDELFEHLMKKEVYKQLAKFARAHNEDKRQIKVEKYENQGLSTKKAIEKANHVLRDEDVRAFLLKYASLLTFSSLWALANLASRQKKHIKDPQKKYRLGMVSKIFYWRA